MGEVRSVVIFAHIPKFEAFERLAEEMGWYCRREKGYYYVDDVADPFEAYEVLKNFTREHEEITGEFEIVYEYVEYNSISIDCETEREWKGARI